MSSDKTLVKEILDKLKSLGYSWEWHSGNYYFTTCTDCFEDSYTFSIEDGICSKKYFVSFNFKKSILEEKEVEFTDYEEELINSFIKANHEEIEWYKNH